MSSPISKKTLDYLAELARLDLDGRREEKTLRDLTEILDYFEELKSVPTDSVAPMTGGTREKNALRDDGVKIDEDLGSGTDAFPEVEGRFLKIPKVL